MIHANVPTSRLVSSNFEGGAAGEEGEETLRYIWLAELIRTTIERGHLGDNQALPSERDMAEKYGVSRVTVRRTLQRLIEQGVVYSEQGRGTFVAPAMVRRTGRFVNGFSEDTVARGGQPGQRILTVEPTLASMGMAGLLSTRVGHPLIHVRRVRFINHEPIGLQDAFVMAVGGLRIEQAELEASGSLYKLMRQRFGVVPTEAVENLSADQAGEQEAELLNVPVGSPLLMCERVTFSERREPIEYCRMSYVPSYRYSTRVGLRSAFG